MTRVATKISQKKIWAVLSKSSCFFSKLLKQGGGAVSNDKRIAIVPTFLAVRKRVESAIVDRVISFVWFSDQL